MADGTLIATMLTGVGGAILCAGLLVCDLLLMPSATRWLAGCVGALLSTALVACLACGYSIELWWPLIPLTLAVVLAAWLARLEDPASVVLRFMKGRGVWTVLLAICVVAANWAACSWAWREGPSPELAPGVQYDEPVPIAPRGVTALGRYITLYQYLPVGEDEEQIAYDMVQNDLRVARGFPDKLIRIGDPDPQTNCHGYVFTRGMYALRSRDVESILADNGFCPMESPEPDDVVVWRNPSGRVIHSGLVRAVTRTGEVVVESKWGPLGLYLHPVDESPYGLDYTYYRCGSAQPELMIEFPGRRPRSLRRGR